MIRLGWADIKTSSPQPRSVRFVEFARTDSASQFDRFLQPCPTTSRPRDIPAGNIRQRQTDLSPHISLSKSLRGCGVVVSEELSQADHDTLICLNRQALGRRLGKTCMRVRQHNGISGPSKLRCPPCSGVRVTFADQSLSEEDSLPRVSGQEARFTWSRRHVRLLFLLGISRGREVVGHRD
jgi:hypothetical protein